MYRQRPMHPGLRPRPGSAPVDPYGMAAAVPQGVPPRPPVPVNPLAPHVRSAPIAAPAGPGAAEAGQQAEQARVLMGRDGIGALAVPPPTDEKNVGYGAIAAPFVGMAAMFPPLAPVAAAFGAASLAEQYLRNKERSRNPSELPLEWENYTPEMKNAWAGLNDPALREEMMAWEASTGRDSSTSDIKNYALMKQENPDLKFTDYMTKYRHKAEGLPSVVQEAIWDAKNSGALLNFIFDKASTETTGSEEAKFLTARNNEMEEIVQKTEPLLAQSYQDTKDLIDLFESGNFDKAGPISGRIYKFFDQDIAALDARAISQTLENLKRVNLAPVTENELKLLAKMYANPAFRTEANIGILKEMLRQIQRTGEQLAPRSDWYRKHGTMKGFTMPINRPWESPTTPEAGSGPVPEAPVLNPDTDPLLVPVP